MTPLAGARGAAVAAVVVVLAAGAVGVTSALEPTPREVSTKPTAVPISNAQLSCPETARGTGITTDLLAVAPAIEGAGSSAGELVAQALSAESSEQPKPIAETDQVGEPLATRLRADATPAVTVNAADGLAPAAYAAQSTTFGTAKQSGLAVAACSATEDSWWFAGINTAVGSTSRLVLSNPTPAVAVVDLAFYGEKGIVTAPGRTGIPLAAHSRQSIDLARFAPGRDAVTLHVSTTRGRVSAAVDVARVTGVSPAGHEWLAPSQPPSSDVLVNAGDAGDGDQRLVLTNVSGREALVDVSVLEQSGPFTPESLTDIRLRPGHTVVQDVSKVTDDAAAFAVTTAQKQAGLVATMVSETPGTPVDLSTASSSPVLSGPAVVPMFDGSRVSFSFASNRPGGGVVQIQGYDDQGAPVGDQIRVSVKARTTDTWTPKRHGEAGLAYLVVTVLEGELQADAHYEARTGRASIPIVSAPTTVTRPAVRPAG